MPQRSQKEIEELLIREFLNHLGVHVEDLVMQDRPDARLSCIVDGRRQTIGLDVTEYQVDAQSQGGSDSRAVESAWNQIWGRVKQAGFQKYRQLRELEVLTYFDRKNPPRTKQANEVADDLVEFLVSVADGVTEEPVFFSRREGAFDGRDHLKLCTEKVRVVKYTQQLGPFRWWPDDAAFVEIVPAVITNTLAKKKKARKGYQLPGADEYWLLIAAGCSTTNSGAGPESLCVNELRSQPIREAVRQSDFDQVYFWERVGDWHERLDPW